MKQIIFLLLFLPAIVGAQITKTAGVTYTSGVPSYTPSLKGSELAVDTITGLLYQYDRDATVWRQYYGIEFVNAAGTPAHTPAYNRSRFALNSDEQLFFWDGVSWVIINEGSDGNGIYSGSGTIPPNTLASAPNGFKMHNNNAGTIQIGDTTTNGARLETAYNYAGFNSDNYTWGMYVDRENVNMVINSPENDIQFGASDVLLSIQSGSSGFLIQDSRASTFGIEYADDYSATIKTNDRCIPDVGAVKSLISDSLAMVSGGSDGNGIYSGSDTISEGTLASFGEELGNAPAFGVGNFPNWPDLANDGTDNGLMMTRNAGNQYYNYQTLISSSEAGNQFGEPARSFVRVSPDEAQIRYIAKYGGRDNGVRSFFNVSASDVLLNGGRVDAEIFARDDAGNRLSNIEFAMEAGDTAYVGTRHPFAKITATKEGAAAWEFGMGQSQQGQFADISSANDTLNYRFYVGAQKYDAFGSSNYGYHTFRVDMPNDTAAHKVSLYNQSYYFPNEVPSAAAGDTAVMAWAAGAPMWLDKSEFGGGGGGGSQTLSIDSTTVGTLERFSVSISGGNTVNFDVPQATSGTVYKTADETINDNNALQNDDHLTFTALANTKYAVKFYLFLEAANFNEAGYQFEVDVPSATTVRASLFGAEDGASTVVRYRTIAGTMTVTGVSTSTNEGYAEITAYIDPGASNRTVTLKWAQDFAFPANNTLKAGSFLEWKKL